MKTLLNFLLIFLKRLDSPLPFFSQVQGNLILASVTQVVVGGLGLVGLILRFVGPLTIAPTISLIGLSLTHVVSDFCGKHWGISLL